jgi:DNA replicative helicase MCM subunit Mcm2 (Cdc46/Mcm family)
LEEIKLALLMLIIGEFSKEMKDGIKIREQINSP